MDVGFFIISDENMMILLLSYLTLHTIVDSTFLFDT